MHCKICNEIEPRQDQISGVKDFIYCLDNLNRNKSFDRMARQGLLIYKSRCLDNNKKFERIDINPFPDITKDEILTHIRTHNRSHNHTMYNLFEFTSGQVNYYTQKIKLYQNQINNLENINSGTPIPVNDNNNNNDDGNNNNGQDNKLRGYKEELERNHDLFERNVNTLLRVDKTINSSTRY